jgi:uracil-DNA glycosylase
MSVRLGNDWDTVIGGEFEKPYYLALREFLRAEYGSYTVYPPMDDIFNAFRAVPYADVKAVILGQDPYHNPGQAHGMCFSVRKGVPPPPSLLNIYKEIDSEFPESGVKCDTSDGCLDAWARQGVLLLNTVLTVRANTPLSHRGRGWERLTDAVIQKLNEREKPVIFMLWGGPARAKAGLITNPRHFVLQAAHPSPLSATGFFSCGHFKRANRLIAENGLGGPIDWQRRAER